MPHNKCYNNPEKERPIAEDEGNGLLLQTLGEATKKVDDTFRMGRDAHLQLAKVKRDLFTDLEEKESGNYIVSGLERCVSKLDFTAFGIAASQILYNQSQYKGGKAFNSGLTQSESKRATQIAGTTQYMGDVLVTLKDICRYAYGVDEPDYKQKKAMEKLLTTLHEKFITIHYPNGDMQNSHLCVIFDAYDRAADGAKLYHLRLHPIFCNKVMRNFGELPQDVIRRLSSLVKRKTEAHYELIRLIGLQKKGSNFSRYIGDLVEDLGLTEDYKTNRGRIETRLSSLFDTAKDLYLIDSYTIEYTTLKGKKRMEKVTFKIASRETMLLPSKTANGECQMLSRGVPNVE